MYLHAGIADIRVSVCMCVCVHFEKDKLYPSVTISYLLSACVSLAGLGSFMQDVLWCFSQVKGTTDIGVAEGKYIFPFVAAINRDSIVVYVLPSQCAGGCSHVGENCWQSYTPPIRPSLCTSVFERYGSLK